MAQQEAARFIEAVASDKELVEKLNAIDLLSEDEPAVEYYARAAKELGFDFTAEEFEAEYQAQKAAREAAADGTQLDDAELEQVAGGGGNYYEKCKDAYVYRQWCWRSDWCEKAINFYRMQEPCKTTYDWMLFCSFADFCDGGFRSYD